jgi:hypothetical protein
VVVSMTVSSATVAENTIKPAAVTISSANIYLLVLF